MTSRENDLLITYALCQCLLFTRNLDNRLSCTCFENVISHMPCVYKNVISHMTRGLVDENSLNICNRLFIRKDFNHHSGVNFFSKINKSFINCDYYYNYCFLSVLTDFFEIAGHLSCASHVS